jgi:nitrogenase molybdenum-iron protein alpha chain
MLDLCHGDTSVGIDLKLKQAPAREGRLGSITGYCGKLRDLGRQAGCGGPKSRERCFTQASSCNAACALGILSYITDAAIVHHGPVGCAVTAMQVSNSKDQLAAKLGLDNSKSCYVCTDMNESDTIFGATEKLKETVRETWRRYGPKAVFIGASCVSGVIGEDLSSAANELRDELGIPVAAVHCEGFKTRIWASGFDAAYHAILTEIVKPPTKKSNVVNIINFFGSARKEITGLLARLGLTPLFLISNTTVSELSRLSESVATLSTCGTLGTYLGQGLQQTYGVPYVRSLQPHGIAGFESWLTGLGSVVGKQSEVQVILAEERDKYLGRIEVVKKRLKGLRAVVGMGPGFNFNTVRAVQELGMEVVHAAAWHFDKQYDDGRAPPAFDHLIEHSTSDFKVSVSDLQNYELISILKSEKPDVFFSRHVGSTVWAMKLGIPALCLYDEYAIFGYRGLLNFAQSIDDVVSNRSLTDNLAARVRLPYTDWWLNQQGDRFLHPE